MTTVDHGHGTQAFAGNGAREQAGPLRALWQRLRRAHHERSRRAAGRRPLRRPGDDEPLRLGADGRFLPEDFLETYEL